MGHAPENTIASFQKALELGCDEVETDVWLTDDGRLLVSHGKPKGGESLTLEAVLDFCRGRMGVNVEVKCEGSEARARAAGARVAMRLAERNDSDAYISSFWWPALEGARGAAADVRRAYLFASLPRTKTLVLDAAAAGLWALHPNRAYVTSELVNAAHGSSLRVSAWTVNDPREIATFKEWGVDGIMSDYPERVPKD